MTDTQKHKLAALTGITKLPEGLRQAPVERQQQAVKESRLGIYVALVGVALYGVTGYLAVITSDKPNLWLLAGAAMLSTMVLVFGASLWQKDLVFPVVFGMIEMLAKGRKAWKGESK